MPVSFSQERLWTLEQIESLGSTYNLCMFLRIAGELRKDVLAAVLREIERRHEALRTCIRQSHDQSLIQIIEPAGALHIERHSVKTVPEPTRHASAMAIACETAFKPFDLSMTLFRVCCVDLADEDCLLVLCVHHIVCDGISIGILLTEMGILYAAFLEGAPSPLPDLPAQYADFAVWQRHEDRIPLLDRQLAYWRGQLRGLQAGLNLPFDRPRPASQTFRGASMAMELPRATAEALRALCRATRATLHMVLVAAFSVVLHRYTGQDDVPIGVPVSGRVCRNTEGIFGFFVNTLVLRTRLDGCHTVRDLIASVRQVALEAYSNQDIPFERVVAALIKKRDPSRHPLFQVMLAIHDGNQAPLDLKGVKVTPESTPLNHSRFDLALDAVETKQGIYIHAEYATDLFDSSTVAQLIDSFVAVLVAAARDPDLALQQGPLRRDFPAGMSIVSSSTPTPKVHVAEGLHGAFSLQAGRSPRQVAIEYDDSEWTYEALDRCTSCLALNLQALGLQAGSVIGTLGSQSLELLGAWLGILKAGGTILPLNSADPYGRLRFIVQDSKALFLLEAARGGRADFDFGIRSLRLDSRLFTAMESMPSKLSDPTQAPVDPACLAYVSGSADRLADGVIIEHRALVSAATGLATAIKLGPSDRVLQIAPPDSEVAMSQMFSTLLSGATLVIATQADIRSGNDLRDFIRRKKVTVLYLTLDLLRDLVAEVTLTQCHSLSRVICSSEEVSAKLALRFRSCLPGATLFCSRGSAETAGYSFVWPCEHEGSGRVCLQQTICATDITVIDPDGQPVPWGIVGEICIAGPSLARGYSDRPKLNAERFISQTHHGRPLRAFRTGDRGRMRADGSLDLIGRLDGRIYLQGRRIERADIEARLREYPGVDDAAVHVWPSDNGSAKLVAYLTGKSASAQSHLLKNHLRSSCPQYMIPEHMICLASIPRRADGRLVVSDLVRPFADDTAYAALTDLESTLMQIWAEAFEHNRIGIHDDYLELGGDSLLAIRIERLAKRRSICIRAADLYEHPTISQLASYVREVAVN